MSTLFDPIQFGSIKSRNRIVMAPLTRNRAGARQIPTAMMALYYEQRSSAGLIVSEATQIAPEAQGYRDTPGSFSPDQLRGWRAVTAAVHAQGGAIVDYIARNQQTVQHAVEDGEGQQGEAQSQVAGGAENGQTQQAKRNCVG